METLNKHHHCGHAGARDLGRIVQRTGGEPVNFAARFLDRLGAQLDEFVIKQDGLDLPQSFPRNRQIALGRKAVTDFSGGGIIATAARSLGSRP